MRGTVSHYATATCRRFGIVILPWLALLCSVPAIAQTRVATVIGAGAYTAVPALSNPPRDARAVAAALRRLGFDTELVLNPDRAALERAIRSLGERARSAEAALFFYAGHALEANDHNYLVPVSARIDSVRDVPFETVDLDLVASQLDGRARVVLIFLDACRDDPFLLHLGPESRSLAGRGLAAPSLTATGTFIAFATAPGHVAADGAGADLPFTTALLRHIETPNLELHALMGQVRHDVREASNGTQIPWESDALEGEFFFRGGPGGQALAPPRTLPATPLPLPAPAPVAAAPRQFAAAAQPRPSAERCRVPPFRGVSSGSGTTVTMEMVADGGDCGAFLYANPVLRVPYNRLFLTTPPMNGTVAIQGNRAAYTPRPGFTGRDRFIISTSPPGSAVFEVTVLPGG